MMNKIIKDLQGIPEQTIDFINRQQEALTDFKLENAKLLKENSTLKYIFPEREGVFTVVGNAVVYSKTTEDYNLFLKEVSNQAQREFAKKLMDCYSNFDEEMEAITFKCLTKTVESVLDGLCGDSNG